MINKIILPFSLGIIISFYWIQPGSVRFSELRFELGLLWIIILLFLILIYTFRRLCHTLPKWWLNGIWSLLGFVEIIISAIETCLLHDPRFRTSYFGKEDIMILRIQVDDSPYTSGNLYHFKARVLERFIKNQKSIKATGNLMVIMPIPVKTINYGQNIYISGRIEKIRGNPHPAFFDYAKYQALHQIYYQVFLYPNQYSLIPIMGGNPFLRRIYGIQNWVLKKIDLEMDDTMSRGFVKTLLIGFRNGIPFEQMQSFIKTGTVHILSISGMHIALLLGLFNRILSPLKKIPFLGSFIFKGTSLSLLWTYALFTGSSPPVLRSAWMTSLGHLSQILRRNTPTLHILMVSAFVQLILEPFNLFDLSFQLSYLALFSIILFQKPIQAYFPIRNPVFKFFSELVIGSLAAQLGTLPLVLFYFHQFPVYFVLANLLVIPLSSLILYEGIAYLVILFLYLPFKPLGALLKYSILWLFKISAFISSLPGSLLNGLYLNFADFFLLSSIIMTLYFYLNSREKLTIHFLKGLFLVSLITFYTQKKIFKHQESVFILAKKNYGLVFYCRGNKAYLNTYVKKGFQNFLMEEEIKTLPTLIRYHRIDTLYIKKAKDTLSSFMIFGGKTILKQGIEFPLGWRNVQNYGPEKTLSLKLMKNDSMHFYFNPIVQGIFLRIYPGNRARNLPVYDKFIGGNFFFRQFN